MTRDALPIKRALNETEAGDQSDVYTLLGTWNAALDEALAESGDRYRTQFRKHREATVELVDAAAVDDGSDWGIGHDDVAVADRTVYRAETENEYWAASVLEQAMYADAHAAIDCYERLLQSEDTIEDLHHVEAMGRIVTDPAPRFPRFWDPPTELDYEGAITDEEIGHLLRVLGEHVHPNRLEQFDDMMAFDLERAASEYGSPESS